MREGQPDLGNDKTLKNDKEQVSRTDPANKEDSNEDSETNEDSVLNTVEIIPGNNDVECPTYFFLSFPVITIAEHTDACCDVLVRDVSNDGKEQSSNCVDEGREVYIIDPALQVTQPETKESIKDILHRLLSNTSFKIPVGMNIRQRHIGKDIEQAL